VASHALLAFKPRIDIAADAIVRGMRAAIGSGSNRSSG
jgi:hypothetical protein